MIKEFCSGRCTLAFQNQEQERTRTKNLYKVKVNKYLNKLYSQQLYHRTQHMQVKIDDHRN